MEYQKITNLLGTTLDEIPRFITKKWVEVHDQSGSADDRYKPKKQIRFKTSMLRSNLCDYSYKNKQKRNYWHKKQVFDNVEDLDIVMPMYIWLEYSKNYRKTTGSLCNYERDKPNNPPLNDDDPPTINYNSDPITNS